MININLLIAYIRHLIKNMTVSIKLNMPSNATIEDLLDVILVYNVTFVTQVPYRKEREFG